MLKINSGTILIFSILYKSNRKIEKILRIIANTLRFILIRATDFQTKKIRISYTIKRNSIGDGEVSRKTKEEIFDENYN